MIAAFGSSTDDVCAVHLTPLDTFGRRAGHKTMLGKVSGSPIVIAPPKCDTLVIAEGVEDALSIYKATGLGCWAAGSAAHLPKLIPSVPTQISNIVVSQDNDKSGTEAVQKLLENASARGICIRALRVWEEINV